MIDKTTEGYAAEPEEVEAVLHNLCGYHLAERDPAFRYAVLTREQVLYDALVAAIKRERGRALADMVASGQTLTQVAQSTNLRTRQRVQRLIAVSKAAEAAAAQLRAASQEFEERMAAVEATLDEVVSGLVPPATDAPPIPAAREPLDDVVAEDSEASDALLEATQSMPALAAVLHRTKEMPAEEAKWWRRNRDTGAA